jgi:hypothetical protein
LGAELETALGEEAAGDIEFEVSSAVRAIGVSPYFFSFSPRINNKKQFKNNLF